MKPTTDKQQVICSKTSSVLMTQRLQTALIVFQETGRESRVGRRARVTGMMSGWGSAWPARTEPTAKYWWVQGHDAAVTTPNCLMRTMYTRKNRPDYTAIIVTNVVPWTALLNHSCSQHYSPRIATRPFLPFRVTCCLWAFCTSTFFKAGVTANVRQIWKPPVQLHNAMKHLPRVWSWTNRWNRVCQEQIVVYKNRERGFREID